MRNWVKDGVKEEKTEISDEEVGSDDDKHDHGHGADAEILKTRISELQLPPRVEQALDNASIRTVGGLVRKREDDLLAIEGLGQKGMQDLKRALSNLGLTLRTQ